MRIFDSVLLPIFDHVRAEVTDTTTFTNEKKRAEVDAWLYETCTQCLQHMVDLVVQFYQLVQPLLSRILDLLSNFIRYGPISLQLRRALLAEACSKVLMAPRTSLHQGGLLEQSFSNSIST